MKSTCDELVIHMSNGIGQRKLYFASHPRVLACSREFTQKLKAFLEESGKECFFLGIVGGKLVHNGRYLVGPTIVGRRLVAFTECLQSGGLLFNGKIEPGEVCELFNLAAELTEPVKSLEEARGMLKARGVDNIEISPAYEDQQWFGQYHYDGTEDWENGIPGGCDGESAIPVYQSLFNTVEVAHRRAGGDHELDVDGARTVTGEMLKTIQGNFMDIMQLVRYPDFDSYTLGHSVRVSLIAVLVGHSLGMNQEFLLELGTAGLLHDVGKSKISEDILFKPGELDKEERRIIMSHPRLGAQILLENREASPLAIGAAWGHHLRHDKKGYPAATQWTVTNRVTELLHVCDVFEALTAVRPYKQALTPRRAYEVMLKDQGGYEPGILAAFVSAMGLYPPGSRLALSNGQQGVVVAAGSDIDKPKVRITHDVGGEVLPNQGGGILDLSSEGAYGVTVSGVLVDGEPVESGEPVAQDDLNPTTMECSPAQ